MIRLQASTFGRSAIGARVAQSSHLAKLGPKESVQDASSLICGWRMEIEGTRMRDAVLESVQAGNRVSLREIWQAGVDVCCRGWPLDFLV